MKKRKINFQFPITLVCFLSVQTAFAQPIGKVVINEYMTWPASACGTTSEFVELLNFGPGPVNIGCYILTTGKYSVTIPPNTVLQAGQFYVIAGQDYIAGNCANIDSSGSGVTADLNWNSCNCTNIPIPTTGHGMMTDGGPANTPLVLFDPALNIVDAVVRKLPAESSVSVTSSSIAGTCTSQTFNIGSMPVIYEELGMSAGRGNSFARTTDGDCLWVKDPQQSGNATNNKSGDVSDISYDFNFVNSTSCGDSLGGSVSIYVKHSDYSQVFPMSYTISLDTNNNGIFDENDQYTTTIDSTEPFIEIDNLPIGHFRVTIGSVKGCYLKTFEFHILPCYANLPVKLVYFKTAGIQNNQHIINWLLQDANNVQSIVLEKAVYNGSFVTEKVFVNNNAFASEAFFTAPVPANSPYQYYRLKITPKSGRSFYSPVINTITGASSFSVNKIWPNPAKDQLHIAMAGLQNARVPYSIYNVNGMMMLRGSLNLSKGDNNISVPLNGLVPGVYQLQVAHPATTGQPISFRFVKH